MKMIEDAERAGRLKPGGAIVEGTSGNTGMGLAIAAVVKGYRCVFTTTDKQSKEKIDALRPLAPRSSSARPMSIPKIRVRTTRSRRGSRERRPTPGRPASTTTCRTPPRTTSRRAGNLGQTGGRITHLVSGVGTGGTISGVGRFLKEQNPAIKVWGIDTYGSAFKKYKDTGVLDKNEIYPYITEGIGEDFLPGNVDFAVIDHFEKVTDKDAAVMTRRIAREEGIFAGNSAGAAIAGLLQLARHFGRDDMVVVIFHDHGTRYLGKMFNDEWMRARGFLEKKGLTARDLVASHREHRLVTVDYADTVARAVQVMTESGYSQMPVTRDGRVIGSVNEACLYAALRSDPAPERRRSAR